MLRNTFKMFVGVIVSAVVVASASRVSAEIVTFADRAAFNAATSSRTDFVWDGLASDGGDAYVGKEQVRNDATMKCDVGLYARNNLAPWLGIQGILYNDGTYANLIGSQQHAGWAAWGFNLYGYNDSKPLSAVDMIWTNDGGNTRVTQTWTFSTAPSANVPQFIGGACTTPGWVMEYMTFHAGSATTNGPMIGLTSYGNYSPVPEPSAVVLLGAGLVGLLAYAWRKRR